MHSEDVYYVVSFSQETSNISFLPIAAEAACMCAFQSRNGFRPDIRHTTGCLIFQSEKSIFAMIVLFESIVSYFLNIVLIVIAIEVYSVDVCGIVVVYTVH